MVFLCAAPSFWGIDLVFSLLFLCKCVCVCVARACSSGYRMFQQLACPGFASAHLGVGGQHLCPWLPGGSVGKWGASAAAGTFVSCLWNVSSAPWCHGPCFSVFTFTVPSERGLLPAAGSRVPLAEPSFSSALGRKSRVRVRELDEGQVPARVPFFCSRAKTEPIISQGKHYCQFFF